MVAVIPQIVPTLNFFDSRMSMLHYSQEAQEINARLKRQCVYDRTFVFRTIKCVKIIYSIFNFGNYHSKHSS
jgi:hypothetical protein